MSLSWEKMQCLLALENTSRCSWEKKTSEKFLLNRESTVCSKTTWYFRESLYFSRYCSQDTKILISVAEADYFVCASAIPATQSLHFVIMDCSCHFSVIDEGSSKCITFLL